MFEVLKSYLQFFIDVFLVLSLYGLLENSQFAHNFDQIVINFGAMISPGFEEEGIGKDDQSANKKPSRER